MKLIHRTSWDLNSGHYYDKRGNAVTLPAAVRLVYQQYASCTDKFEIGNQLLSFIKCKQRGLQGVHSHGIIASNFLEITLKEEN